MSPHYYFVYTASAPPNPKGKPLHIERDGIVQAKNPFDAYLQIQEELNAQKTAYLRHRVHPAVQLTHLFGVDNGESPQDINTPASYFARLEIVAERYAHGGSCRVPGSYAHLQFEAPTSAAAEIHLQGDIERIVAQYRNPRITRQRFMVVNQKFDVTSTRKLGVDEPLDLAALLGDHQALHLHF